MAQPGDPTLHFYMTRRMARMIGVNLGAAMRQGRLDEEGYAELVTRCQNCPFAQSCQMTLATSVDLPSIPKHCANRAALSHLRIQ